MARSKAEFQGDVAVDADCRRVAKAVLDKWGRIDALVNSAGTTKFVAHADLEGLSAEDFEAIFRVNLIGPFQMIRACLPALKALEGLHRQRLVGGLDPRHRLVDRLRRVEGRARHHEPFARARARARDPRQRRRAGLRAHAVAGGGARRRGRGGAGAALRRARPAQGRARGAGRRRGDRLAASRARAASPARSSTSTAACTSLRRVELTTTSSSARVRRAACWPTG